MPALVVQLKMPNRLGLCCSILNGICVWRRLVARLIRLGVQKGVGRRASPYRRKNNGAFLVVLAERRTWEHRVYEISQDEV